jgi:hypothetical protein
VQAGRRAGSSTAFAMYGYVDPKKPPEIGGNTSLIHKPDEVLALLDAVGMEI